MFRGFSHIDRKRMDCYVGHEESTGVEWYIRMRFGEWVARRDNECSPSISRKTLGEINSYLASH